MVMREPMSSLEAASRRVRRTAAPSEASLLALASSPSLLELRDLLLLPASPSTDASSAARLPDSAGALDGGGRESKSPMAKPDGAEGDQIDDRRGWVAAQRPWLPPPRSACCADYGPHHCLRTIPEPSEMNA